MNLIQKYLKMKNNGSKVKIFLIASVLIILFYNQIFAQSDQIIQPLYPHPVIELNEWLVHSGDLTLNKVFENNPSLWQKETLNNEW